MNTMFAFPQCGGNNEQAIGQADVVMSSAWLGRGGLPDLSRLEGGLVPEFSVCPCSRRLWGSRELM